MENAGGWGAAQINYNTPSTAEMLQQGATIRLRQKERDDEQAYRQQQLALQRWKYQQDLDKDKLDWAQKATDPTKYVSGQTAIDQHAQDVLGNVMQEILADPNFSSESLPQLMMQYSPYIQSVAQGHIVAKQQLDKAYKQIDDAAKDNPNLDAAKLKQYAFSQVGQSVLDEHGNYRAPDQIDLNRDIVGAALQPENAWQYSLGGSQLIDNLRKFKGEDVNMFHRNGDASVTTYSANLTPFHRLNVTPDAGGFVKQQPQLSIAAEQYNTIKDANGNPMKVLPADIFYDNLYNTKANQTAFDAMYNTFKQQSGIKTTPQTDEVLKRAYAYRLLNDVLPHQAMPKNIEHLPKQPNISINMGGGIPVYHLYDNVVNSIRQNPDGSTKDSGIKWLSELPQDAVQVILPHAQKAFGKMTDDSDPYNTTKTDLTAQDLKLAFDGNTLRVINVKDKGKSINIDKTWLDRAVNSQKQDYQVEAAGNSAPPVVPQQHVTKPTTTSTHFIGLPKTGKF